MEFPVPHNLSIQKLRRHINYNFCVSYCSALIIASGINRRGIYHKSNYFPGNNEKEDTANFLNFLSRTFDFYVIHGNLMRILATP